MGKIAVLFETEPNHGGEHQYAVLLAECLLKNTEFIAICGNRFWTGWCREHKVRYVKKNWIDYDMKDMERWIKYPRLSKIVYGFLSPLGIFLRQERIKLLIIAQHGSVFPQCYCNIMYPVHDLMHRYFRRFPEFDNKENIFRELLFRNVAQSASVVLVDSVLGREQFIKAYSEYMRDFTKVYPLPYVAPPHVWETQEQYIATPERYIFYPAQFWMHKNHLNLIKAVELVRDKLPDIHLILVGSEKNYVGKIKRYINEHNLQAQVTIIGFVKNEQIIYLYRHAVAMFMPSYFGPTNIPPLEAMALGCPVAVSNNFAMGEQVGNAGLLFDPDSPEEIAECIYAVWSDEAKRQQMIQEGYNQTNLWNRQKFEERFMKIVRELCG